MSNFYDQLCQTFIRPSRQVYNAYDLGQPLTQKSRRIDFHVVNNRQHKIMCSYYNNIQNPFAPCIVYLHCLNGSRLQSIPFVDRVIKKGFNFCNFDFSGTGLSQGKYVSLGYFQKFDIQAVLQYLSQNFNSKRFILWGRSMGAAAAIKFLSMAASCKTKTLQKLNSQIDGIILDSPFHSLSQLTIKIAKQKINIPEIFIKAVLLMVQSTIQSKAGFKISQMELLQDVKQIKCPVLLLTSKDDKLVNSSQSQKIYQTIKHKDRQIVFITGQHNSNRESDIIECILQFAKKLINKKKPKINTKQIFVKSTKILTYKGANTSINSSVANAKSSHRLQFNSFQVNKCDTCGDEDIPYIRSDDQTQNQNIPLGKSIYSNIMADQLKKSLNLRHNKFIQMEQKMPANKIFCSDTKFINYRPVNDQRVAVTPSQSKININQFQKKIQVNFQYQSQKKVASSAMKCDKISYQINKSPIKQPPKLNSQKRVPHAGFNTPVSKNSSKKNNEIQINKSLGIDQVLSQSKGFDIRKNTSMFTPNNTGKKQIIKQLNHFNIINEKLKKKKKNEINNEKSPRIKQIQDLQTFSIPMQRKSQIPTKSPPQFIKGKLQQHQNLTNSKNH